MNTPKIEVHQYDGVKSSLHTGKLLPGERGYAGGESATPRTDDAQILASFNEVEPPHYPRAFLAVKADFARQLERETATLHAQIARMKQREGELVGALKSLTKENVTYDGAQIIVPASSHWAAMETMRAARAALQSVAKEGDELRAELLTTHQMACRVGLGRDELAKLLGEAADELAVPGYDAPPISKGVQNLLSRIRAALQSLRALTEQPGKP